MSFGSRNLSPKNEENHKISRRRSIFNGWITARKVLRDYAKVTRGMKKGYIRGTLNGNASGLPPITISPDYVLFLSQSLSLSLLPSLSSRSTRAFCIFRFLLRWLSSTALRSNTLEERSSSRYVTLKKNYVALNISCVILNVSIGTCLVEVIV